MAKVTKEELQISQAELKRDRIANLILNKPVDELDNLTLKHATQMPFYTGLTISRRLSGRTIDCTGKIEPIYKTVNNKKIKGYRIESERIEEINGKLVRKLITQETFRPIIFALSHIGKFDIEIVAEKLPHFFLLSGDYENLHGTTSGTLLEKHGIIYLDMKDKEDRRLSKEVIKQVLISGNNVLWCIEGTWNFSPNQLIQYCPFGVGEVSEASGAVIVPIGVQQYNDKDFYIRVGEIIDPIKIRSEHYLNDAATKKEITRTVRDGMATQVYNIIENYGMTLRESIPDNAHEEYIEKRLAEWNFTYGEVLDKGFIPPDIITNKMAFEHTSKISIEKAPYLLNKRFTGVNK